MTSASLEFGIVLCAGLGVRLQPLTNDWPKPLLRFLDRPIANYALDALEAAGVSTVGVNAHHCAERVSGWIRDEVRQRDGFQRHATVMEDVLMGTGGGASGVWRALEAPGGTVAVLNGDLVTDVDLRAMLKVHRRTGAVATMMTIPALSDEATVLVDRARHFVAQVPGPDDVWVSPDYEPHHAVTFAGVYLLEREVFEGLPNGVSCLVRHGVGPLLARGARVACHHWEGFWADLGTPSRFLAATREVLDDPARLSSAGLPERSHQLYGGDSRSVHPAAKLIGPVYVAPGATIGRDAVVGPYVVVGTDCSVAAGAVVRNTVLMHGARVEGHIDSRIVSANRAARVGT